MGLTVTRNQLMTIIAVVFFTYSILECCIPAIAAQPSSQANAPISKAELCYPDEPVSVTVTGALTEQTFPGPPNYESVVGGDEPETVFLLNLNPSICTIGYTLTEMEKNGYWDSPHTGINRMELVFVDDPVYLYRYLRPYLGKTVHCTGKLFDAENGHHHTLVLIAIFKRNCSPILGK